jgi:hypothetical protein
MSTSAVINPSDPDFNTEPEDIDGPDLVECSECGVLIPDDDSGNIPYCAKCWNMLDQLSSLSISRY